MKLWCDLHLHSCLSPCGGADMTPHNLVNMAALLGYDAIAVTDHNTAGNCAAAIEAGVKAGITVIPGMELCTAEEIHMVCLFPGLDNAQAFWQEVRRTLPPVHNKPHLFGEQIYMDAQDNILGREDILLVTASALSVEESIRQVQAQGGVCYPAHIDRPSYSILASLGVIPPELELRCCEMSREADEDTLLEQHPILQGMCLLRASDAHRLEDMPDPQQQLKVSQNTAWAIIDSLQNMV